MERETIHFGFADCAYGSILLALSKKGICALFLGDSLAELQEALAERFPYAELEKGGVRVFEALEKASAFVNSPKRSTQFALDLRGTVFQLKVWEELKRIPIGQTVDYKTLAERIGTPAAVRAVANACGANPVAVIVPCHRVIRADGRVSGYRWGKEIKEQLLKREQVNAAKR